MTDNTALQQKIAALGPWFHNIHLPDGTQTAPDHFLGDFPAFKWKEIQSHIPEDLTGKTVLDIGCNAGFYSIELARRGAKVTGIDLDPHYLEQAKWVVEQHGLSQLITLKQQQVYDLAREDQQYDIVWFMGVLYHLRYPLLALDILAKKTKKMLVFQTLTMPGEDHFAVQEDYQINERDKMLEPGWPKMAFIENKLNGDPTNWWAPNMACIEAMLRTCGFKITARPGHELFICQPDPENPGINELWNKSEYLSAVGKDWHAAYAEKVSKG